MRQPKYAHAASTRRIAGPKIHNRAGCDGRDSARSDWIAKRMAAPAARATAGRAVSGKGAIAVTAITPWTTSSKAPDTAANAMRFNATLRSQTNVELKLVETPRFSGEVVA